MYDLTGIRVYLTLHDAYAILCVGKKITAVFIRQLKAKNPEVSKTFGLFIFMGAVLVFGCIPAFRGNLSLITNTIAERSCLMEYNRGIF